MSVFFDNSIKVHLSKKGDMLSEGNIIEFSGEVFVVKENDVSYVTVVNSKVVNIGLSSKGSHKFVFDIAEGATINIINSSFCEGFQDFEFYLKKNSRLTFWDARSVNLDQKVYQRFNLQKIKENCVVDFQSSIILNGGVFVQQFNGLLNKESVGSVLSQKTKVLKTEGGCRVLIEPNIVVETPEVKASHGVAQSYLSDDDLHALMARGFDKLKAKDLLISSFLLEVILKSKQSIDDWKKMGMRINDDEY